MYQQASYWNKEIIYNRSFTLKAAWEPVKGNGGISSIIIGPTLLLEKITKDVRIGESLRSCFEKTDADGLLSPAWHQASPKATGRPGQTGIRYPGSTTGWKSYTEVKFEGKYKPVKPEKAKAQRGIFGIFEIVHST